jgi:hypothetical protein
MLDQRDDLPVIEVIDLAVVDGNVEQVSCARDCLATHR